MAAAAGQVPTETRRLYRVHRTVCEMLQDRGYLLNEETSSMTLLAFSERVDNSDDIRKGLAIVAPHSKNAQEVIRVIFPSEEKVGVKSIKDARAFMQDRQIQRGIVVIQQGLSPFAKTAIAATDDGIIMEHFTETELLVNITKHELVPKHTIMSKEDQAKLLKRYKLKNHQLPRIQVNDPIARYYGMTKGTVVKIVRPSETAGRYVTYRIVV